MISFSAGCEKWRDHIQPASEENCHDAVRWASRFVATGNTCTLEAIEVSYCVHQMNTQPSFFSAILMLHLLRLFFIFEYQTIQFL